MMDEVPKSPKTQAAIVLHTKIRIFISSIAIHTTSLRRNTNTGEGRKACTRFLFVWTPPTALESITSSANSNLSACGLERTCASGTRATLAEATVLRLGDEVIMLA
jgi:hypothetical protein